MTVSGLKCLARLTPRRNLLNVRGFAQERSTSSNGDCDDVKRGEAGTSSVSKGAKKKNDNKSCDDDAGEIPTPSLKKATSTKDFFNTTREQRLREKAKQNADVLKLQETFRKGASTADLDSG